MVLYGKNIQKKNYQLLLLTKTDREKRPFLFVVNHQSTTATKVVKSFQKSAISKKKIQIIHLSVSPIELRPSSMQTGLHVPNLLICREKYVLSFCLKCRLGSRGNSFAHETCGWKFKRVILTIIILPASAKLKEGYTDFSAVHPFIHLLVYLRMESCPLCILHNTCWIHFIFMHLINQLLIECCKFYIFLHFFRFVTLILIALFSLRMKEIWYESMVLIIMEQRRVFWKCKHSSCCSSYWFVFSYRTFSVRAEDVQLITSISLLTAT